ncbi:MAG: YhcH/YjgK/YiaL family protein [Planctomycetes bacterium]|nr:YhcH/YjgK/YiaL family protein [Planctomycetota bacterium]
MIYGDIAHFRGKFCTSEAVKKALDFLMDKAPSLEDGTHDVADGIFIQLKCYSPEPAANRRYESHVKYIDLQVVYEGEEIIYNRPLDPALAVTEDLLADRDLRFHAEPAPGPEVALTLRPGLFALLMPQDMHKTECFCGTAKGRKAIAKIPVELVKF